MRRVSFSLVLAGAVITFHSHPVEAQSRATVTRVNATYPSNAPSSVTGGYIVGDVVLEVQTRTDGSVGSACILRSIPMFQHYALDAALGWRYEPVVVDRGAVEAVMTETIHFTPPAAQQIARR